jgi:hypothetical protein
MRAAPLDRDARLAQGQREPVFFALHQEDGETIRHFEAPLIGCRSARHLCGLGCQGLLGVQTSYGPNRGGVGAPCVTLVLGEHRVVGDNNRDLDVPREINGKRGRVSV